MQSRRGLARPLLFLSGALVGAVAALLALRHLDVVEVDGASMLPTFLPGDRLVVESWTYSRRQPRVGELVLAPDPRQPVRELVKRVAGISDGVIELRGDAADASTDSRAFGGVPVDRIRWRVAGRYWPPR
jgi:nickel-type superoxide dismutase maturation protease